MALYQKSKDEGSAFAEKYLNLLRAGGKDSPHVLARLVDVDLNDPNFWRGGFQVVESLIDSFESLAQAAKSG